MTYIALLRAINVGGHNVKMEELRRLFEELGFANVRTYIQSGNVFFDTDNNDAAGLTARIESHLEKNLGYPVPAILRTVGEFEAALTHSPFSGQTPAADERFMVVFTNAAEPFSFEAPAVSDKQDCEIVGYYGRELYERWIIINGRPPSDAKLLKGILGGANGTGRFYHTCQKILAAAKSA